MCNDQCAIINDHCLLSIEIVVSMLHHQLLIPISLFFSDLWKVPLPGKPQIVHLLLLK